MSGFPYSRFRSKPFKLNYRLRQNFIFCPGKNLQVKPSIPQTPAAQIQSGQSSSPPGAPIKTASRKIIEQYFATLQELVLNLAPSQDSNEDDVVISLPPGPASDKMLDIATMQRWQWYPFGKNGVSDGTVVSLKSYIVGPDIESEMKKLQLGANEPTPSKPGKGVAPIEETSSTEQSRSGSPSSSGGSNNNKPKPASPKLSKDSNNRKFNISNLIISLKISFRKSPSSKL